jgi:DNA-directed RNA polymerase subunit RPC12/RpoP
MTSLARACAATSERKTQSLLCWNCGRTLLEYQSPVGLVSIRCRRCGCQNVLTTDDVELRPTNDVAGGASNTPARQRKV